MFFSLQNNQNRQQKKLVNMVNENDLIKHNYWPYLYHFYISYVFLLKTEWYLDLYMAYMFQCENITLQPFLKTLNFARHLS